MPTTEPFNGQDINEFNFFNETLRELERARAKFPTGTFGVWKCLCALTEEVGELNQACLQRVQEPEKNVTLADIRAEAIQVAAMAMRVILDADWEHPSANP